MRLKIVAGLVALVMVAVAVFVSVRHFTSDDSVTDIGAGVKVIGDMPRDGLKAKQTAPIQPFNQPVEFVSHGYEIGPSGKLGKPTTFELPLKRAVGKNEHVVIATLPSGKTTWEAARPSSVKVLTVNGKPVVRFTVDHLSLFEAIIPNVGVMLNEFKKQFVDTLTSNLTAGAERPKCDREQEAQSDGFTVASSHKNTIYWCLGKEGNKHVIKVVNTRRYPLVIDHPGMKVLRSPHADLLSAAQHFKKLFNETSLFPREEIVFHINMKKGQSVKLQTELDGIGQGIYQLQVGIETLLSVVAKFGFDKKSLIGKSHQLYGYAKCFNAMEKLVAGADEVGHVFMECLDPDKLWELYGVAGALLAPVSFAGGFLSFMRTQVEGLIDSATRNHFYTVVVKWQDGQVLTFRDMTLRLPSNWKIYRGISQYDTEMVGIAPGNGCVVRDYWETSCPYILLAGSTSIDDMFGGTAPYHQTMGGYFPTGGITYCPGKRAEKLWIHESPANGHPASSQRIGDRTARAWKIPVACGKNMPGTGPQPPIGYMQTEYLLPESKILFVVRDRIPGIDQVLANATFREN